MRGRTKRLLVSAAATSIAVPIDNNPRLRGLLQTEPFRREVAHLTGIPDEQFDWASAEMVPSVESADTCFIEWEEQARSSRVRPRVLVPLREGAPAGAELILERADPPAESAEMAVMVSRLEQRFNEERAEADARMEQRFNKERARMEQRLNKERAEADARMERMEQRLNKERARGDKERARGDKMEQRLNEERARGDKMELKHEEQDAEMKTMKQEQAELRGQSKNQSKYIRHLMGAYWQSLQLSKRRMLKAARTQVFERIEDYKSYSVAQLIKYIKEDAWGEFDAIDKWIVSAYADVSGEIHHNPDWFEALQVYQIGGDPDFGGDPNYRTVFSRLYDRHPTPEELRSVELSLPVPFKASVKASMAKE